MWELAKLELRKALPFYVPLLAVTAGVVLNRGGVLSRTDPWLVGAGAVLGAAVALRLFTDAAGTRSFLFSRPFTRRRLFLVRWGLGLALIALALAAAAACVAAGPREWIQLRFHGSSWYPMARWYDLNGMWPLALSALLAYGATFLLVIKNDLDTAASPSVRRWRSAATVGSVVGLLGLAMVAVVARAIFSELGSSPYAAGLPMVLAYTLIVNVASSLAALHGYERLPVEG